MNVTVGKCEEGGGYLGVAIGVLISVVLLLVIIILFILYKNVAQVKLARNKADRDPDQVIRSHRIT